MSRILHTHVVFYRGQRSSPGFSLLYDVITIVTVQNDDVTPFFEFSEASEFRLFVYYSNSQTDLVFLFSLFHLLFFFSGCGFAAVNNF